MNKLINDPDAMDILNNMYTMPKRYTFKYVGEAHIQPRINEKIGDRTVITIRALNIVWAWSGLADIVKDPTDWKLEK